METLSTALTVYLKTEDNLEQAGIMDVISDGCRQLLTLIVNVFLCGIVSFLGMITNVINLVIFYRQVLDTTINIGFFSLAFSDLCTLILQQWYILWVNPLFENADLPVVYTDIQYLTGGLPREAFARITCLITAYITAERCLCITFPLHIKQMITPRTTTIAIFLIYGLTLISFLPLYCTSYYDWSFFTSRNRTLLSLVITTNYEAAQSAVYIIHAMCGVVSCLAVVAFTFVLIQKLTEKSAWRKTVNVHQEKSESLSLRDRRTMSMVVLIASILIICYTPAVILCIATFYEPEFCVGGRYCNLYYTLWLFATLLENINSSVNFFLYLIMSTKFRQTCVQLFP